MERNYLLENLSPELVICVQKHGVEAVKGDLVKLLENTYSKLVKRDLDLLEKAFKDEPRQENILKAHTLC